MKLTAVGRRLYFSYDDHRNGQELWWTNGTPGRATMITDLNRRNDSDEDYYDPWVLGHMRNTVYFAAHSELGKPDMVLWKTDGTRSGTKLVKDINLAVYGSDTVADRIDGLASVGKTFLFGAVDYDHGEGLWRTDGTSAGTTLVKDIRAGDERYESYDTDLALQTVAVLGGALYFSAGDGVHGRELWRTDGTEAGTKLVKDIRPGKPGGRPIGIGVVGGRLYFSADDGVHGRELWRSAGAAKSTQMVKDAVRGRGGVGPRYLVKARKQRLYFFGAGGGLWRSTGTSSGTVPVLRTRN
jgi:ELWxxDGT repeat protein